MFLPLSSSTPHLPVPPQAVMATSANGRAHAGRAGRAEVAPRWPGRARPGHAGPALPGPLASPFGRSARLCSPMPSPFNPTNRFGEITFGRLGVLGNRTSACLGRKKIRSGCGSTLSLEDGHYRYCKQMESTL